MGVTVLELQSNLLIRQIVSHISYIIIPKSTSGYTAHRVFANDGLGYAMKFGDGLGMAVPLVKQVQRDLFEAWQRPLVMPTGWPSFNFVTSLITCACR